MQSFVINNSGLPALTPISASVRATLPTPAPQDLRSTLPPVQPAEPNSSPITGNELTQNLYNRFARLTGEFTNSAKGPDRPGTGSLPAIENGRAEVNPATTDGNVNPVQSQSRDAINSGEEGTLQKNADDPTDQERTAAAESTGRSPSGLTELQLKEVRELAARDREVRSHEQAHVAVGGQYAGAPQYSLQRGPDGVSYAVGGEVPIDVAAIPGDPQATILKMQQVRRAALAPANPSPQDRAVSAQASQTILQARTELSQQQSNATGQTGRDESQPASDGDLTDQPRVEDEAVLVYREFAGLQEEASNSDSSSRILEQII